MIDLPLFRTFTLIHIYTKVQLFSLSLLFYLLTKDQFNEMRCMLIVDIAASDHSFVCISHCVREYLC